MAQILQNKNLATKFQILIEIAANQPNVQQKLIAMKICVTPQAVSEYIKGMLKEGLIASDGRSRYQVTREGVDWIIKMARELQDYSAFVGRAITNATVCASLASGDISKGQVVSLEARNGILYASASSGEGARGIAASNAKDGEDIGISHIEGIVDLTIGSVTVMKVPAIERGGSKNVNLKKLEAGMINNRLVGAIGIEALSALKKIHVVPQYFYGVREAVVEAAYSGMSAVVVCVDDQISSLIQRLEKEGIDYEILDMSSQGSQSSR